MKKNNVIAFSLIALIFVVFYWYNSKSITAQQTEQRRLDSLAKVELLKQEVERAMLPRDTSGNPIIERQTPQIEAVGSVYGNEMLDAATQQEEAFYTLENDLLKVKISNRGASPRSVLVKDYQTGDGRDLLLFDGPKNELSMRIFANQQLNTGAFIFVPVQERLSDSSLRMRLYVDSLSYIEYAYTLPAHSYMMNLDVSFVGMQQYIPRNHTQFDLLWNVDIARLERGYENEKNYSTLVYKFSGSEDTENLGLRKTEGSEQLKTKVEWVAFQQQFFSAILLAPQSFSSGRVDMLFYPPESPDGLLMNTKADMQVEFDPAVAAPVPFQFYFGPNHYTTLKSYGHNFQKIVPMGGWGIGWINRYFIIPVFNFLNQFIESFGLIIFIMTLLIKIILFYPNHKSYLSSAKMRVLRPEIEKINAKYPKKDDAIKKQQETMALYKKTGVSMFGGCLPMLFQLPILFAMFRFFPGSFELRQEGFLWADDLSTYDSVLNLPFSIPMYGDHVSLFALLMAISMFFYSRMNMDQMNTGQQQMPGMKGMMLYFMPAFMLVICNNFSSGLCYYYLLYNLITMFQTWVTRKFIVNEKRLYEQLQAKAASAQPVQKSKFQQRLDEAYKLQQQRQQQQQQQKKRR